MFTKVLIANRGEIAVRVIRALRELGIASVAVYSDADAGALATRLADEAVRIGPAEPAKSYLDMDAIVEATRATGADAIHPGYGFLSENPRFARRLAKEAITFIGPPPEAMEALGEKVSARVVAARAGVPTPPGTGVLGDVDAARKAAAKVGFPVIFKASAGGGGIGMQIAQAERDVAAAFERAKATAEGAFGDGSVFLEKFLGRPRHVEIQILADAHGSAIHLGERECSIQRRYQKLIEEAPSPGVTDALRRAMGDAALRLVREVGYVNAGTLEFLVEDGTFYFNEMNTRLQVEHPVTEMVTGVDLVKEQVRVAAGERLRIQQSDIVLRGHAIECRVNAEDPAQNFAPAPGDIDEWHMPAGPGVRVDAYGEAGGRIPPAYDSMAAKIIVWGRDRAEACDRMRSALDEARVTGIATNLPFHRMVLRNGAFLRGDTSTRFIEEQRIVERLREEAAEVERRDAGRVAAVAVALATERGGLLRFHAPLLPGRDDAGPRPASRWVAAGRRRALRGRGP